MALHRESYCIPGKINGCYDAKWILVLFSAAHRKKGLHTITQKTFSSFYFARALMSVGSKSEVCSPN